MNDSETMRGEIIHPDIVYSDAARSGFIRWMGRVWLIAPMLLVAALASAQERELTVRGSVRDDARQPIPYVTVRVPGTRAGAITDRAGRFTLRIRGGDTMRTVRLRGECIGYDAAEIEIVNDRSGALDAELVLLPKTISMKEVVVTASAFTADERATATMKPLDVVTTPGAAADILRAIQSLPGVTALQESAGLFVRGGDVSETIMLLDGATVMHPYRYESPVGGMFGTIPPFLVDGVFFAAGGFPARYGNALSGVLAMESRDLPEDWGITAGLGLAAASAGIEAPIVPDRLGVHFSGNHSMTDLMLRVNGRRDEFSEPPHSLDGNLSIIYRYSPSGQIKLFNYATAEEIGVHAMPRLHDPQYRATESSRLHNAQWRDLFGRWGIAGSLSYNRFDSRSRLGLLDLTQGEGSWKLRLDLDREIGDQADPFLRVLFGGEIEQITNRFTGAIPADPRVLDSGGAVHRLDESYMTERTGGYLEAEAKILRHLFLNGGARVDYLGPVGRATIDPRASLRYQLGNGTSLRFSWGLYHQTPSPYQLNAASGNPDLRSSRARHLIAGAEHTDGPLLIRIEGYDKEYSGLILRDVERNFSDRGTGVARGVDLFIKYGAFLETPASGWLSYSFLHARRLQERAGTNGTTYETAPARFDITHNLALVAKYEIIGGVSMGAALRYATGAPVTPIVGATHDTATGTYAPIEGPLNSERLPDYLRFDLDLSYYLPFNDGSFAVFYVAATNVLDRNNVIGYDYSIDYSTRTPRRGNFERSIYFGATVTLRP